MWLMWAVLGLIGANIAFFGILLVFHLIEERRRRK